MFGLVKNSRGFTLAEVMVALGISGIVSMGAMSLIEMTNKSYVEMEYQAELTSFQNEVGRILSNNAHCSATLSGLATPSSATNFTNIPNFNRMTSGGATRIENLSAQVGGFQSVANKYGKRIVVRRVVARGFTELKDYAGTYGNSTDRKGFTDVIFHIEVRRARASRAAGASQKTFNAENKYVVFPIAVTASTATGQISECTSNAGHLDETELTAKLCSAMGTLYGVAGATCAAVVANRVDQIKRSICEDLFGTDNWNAGTNTCTHPWWGVSCPGNQVVVGIQGGSGNTRGDLLCGNPSEPGW